MLKIEKTSDHKIYKEGQTGSYKIRVTQKNEGMTAHKVIIEDSFEKKGMDIGMIRVKYNGKISQISVRSAEMIPVESLRSPQEEI